MSRNRLNGDSLTTSVLPTAAGGTYQEGLTDDVLAVPAAFAAGAHTVNLNGTIAGQAVPGDGDQLDITDPLGLLGPATTLLVVGKIAGLGAQISDGRAAADSVLLNEPGVSRLFTYAAATGTWIMTNSSDRPADPPVVLADAAATTITVAQGLWRTLVATQANSVTLSAVGALRGQVITLTRTDTSAFAVSILNGGPAAGTLIALVASKQGFADCQFDGTNWLLKRCSAS